MRGTFIWVILSRVTHTMMEQMQFRVSSGTRNFSDRDTGKLRANHQKSCYWWAHNECVETLQCNSKVGIYGFILFYFFLVVIVTCYNLSPAIRSVWRLWLPLFHGRGKHMLNYYLFCIPEDEKMKILMIWRWTPLSPEPAQFIVCDFQILSVQRGLCNPSIFIPHKNT